MIICIGMEERRKDRSLIPMEKVRILKDRPPPWNLQSRNSSWMSSAEKPTGNDPSPVVHFDNG